MSRLFGEMRQLAFVVRDLDRALRYWTETLGVGPFFMMRDLVPENWRYRGEPSPAPRITLALGYSGEFQINAFGALRFNRHQVVSRSLADFLLSDRPDEWVARGPDVTAAIPDIPADQVACLRAHLP